MVLMALLLLAGCAPAPGSGAPTSGSSSPSYTTDTTAALVEGLARSDFGMLVAGTTGSFTWQLNRAEPGVQTTLSISISRP
jgi:hypothetical protein